MPSEAQARIRINKLLEEAGWRFFPDEAGQPATILCEHRTHKGCHTPHSELGTDYEHAPGGFVDYVLLNTDGRPVAVIEAKRSSVSDPRSAKEQARAYAEGLGVVHIFLSNGSSHFYWNLRQGNPTRVSRFFPLDQLGKASEWEPNPLRLAGEPVGEDYIALSQDSAWHSYTDQERERAKTNRNIRLLRDYQVQAVRKLQMVSRTGTSRFLLEMATGTGKTLLSATIAKLYLRTNNAHRILFLVDRLELESQAWRCFNTYLANDGIQTVIYKQKKQDWKTAQIVVTTIQSLATRNRWQTDFAPTDFQLIISDEAHRTISGNHRVIFEYFVGAKLGLTATPKDYLKGFDDLEAKDDPKEYERRLLLDTYKTFGCEDGQPTFRFSLSNAVSHRPPYLVNPHAIDARTDITTQMLSKEGYVVTTIDPDGQEMELCFTKSAYERRFFSDETNSSFVRCFLDNARLDPLTGEVGKTIIFAVSRAHATKLASILNEEASRRWPAAYGAGSFFAVQVTSDQPMAQQMTIDFANNNLNGKTRWKGDQFRDYNSSRTRVCVTVGMMTTGYDCEDLLNVVLARPILSPTDFIQIKGRGTRLFTFRTADNSRAVSKADFALIDFFANCEYFEKDFNYDAKVALPAASEPTPNPETGPVHRTDSLSNTSPDPIATVLQIAIDESGMRIDREMFRSRFRQKVAEAVTADPVFRANISEENWPAIEGRAEKLLTEAGDPHHSVQNLRDAFKTDRLPSFREVLAYAMGLTPCIADRKQLAQEAFQRYLSRTETPPALHDSLQALFVSYLLDAEVRNLLNSGRFAEIGARDPALYGALTSVPVDTRRALLDYLATQVPLADFDKAA